MNEYFINTPTNSIAESKTTSILKESKAFEYHRSLSNYQSTPLIHLPGLAARYNVGHIYIKNEAPRFGLNSFKSLGTSYAIHKILETDTHIKTFCTATDGNHGRAVAWASRINNRNAIVFVPRGTTPNRIKAIENEGATVTIITGNYDETCTYAEKISKQEGWQLIQDSAWENYEETPAQIMAGYLTQLKELESTLHCLPKCKIDIVFLQAGVGSWAGSAIWYYLDRYGNNRPKIVIIEPSESAGILASFKAGVRVTPEGNFKTVMAGLNCGIPSLSAWEIIKNGADIALSTKDEFAERAIRELYYANKNDPSIMAGESGVGGLAGFIALMTKNELKPIKDHLNISSASKILFYNTEGATDPDSFNAIVKSKV